MKKGLITIFILSNILIWSALGYLYMSGDFVISKGAENLTIEQKIANIPADKINEQTFHLESLTTNLASGHYAVIGFSFLTDDSKTASELKSRQFQINDYLIKTFSAMTHTQLRDEQETSKMINELQAYLNDLLSKGEVLQVYVTNKIVN